MTPCLLHVGHGGGFDPFAVFADTGLDFLRLLPFLFLACLLSEWLSSRASRARLILSGGGRLGPLFGAIFGVIPQCGLSAAAARLYSARLVSLGTLLAVFLSTSDEMLPVLLAGGIAPLKVILLVLLKLGAALAVGFLVDAFVKGAKGEASLDDILEDDTPCPCGCGSIGDQRGWVSLLFGALRHTLVISFYLFLTMLAFAFAVSLVGEERLADLLSSAGIFSVLLSALVGLIPNCAVSIVLSELWAVGAISTGSLLAGLLVGAGVGLLVLFRINRPLSDTLRIVLLLLGFGILFGLLVDLSGIGWLLSP